MQLTVMNGSSRRGELVWMDLAMSSLPVPDSPRMSTVDLDGAARSTMSMTCCMPLPRAMMLPLE